MGPTSYQAALPRDSGGEIGIRTLAPVSRPAGFQDQSLQPDLGISPDNLFVFMVDPVGLEPTTTRL